MAKTFSRRTLLKSMGAMGALAAVPHVVMANTVTNPDVVIVGAGAAGLAAARTLQEAGKSVLILEATDKIGGRAITDHDIFGVPYDLGASWLHNGKHNPYVDYGINNGFDVYRDPDQEAVYVGNKPATGKQAAELERLLGHAINRLDNAGERRRDISIAKALGDLVNDKEWGPVIMGSIGPWEMGEDLDRISVLDWYSQEGGPDWLCREGFGTLVAHYGRGLPVQLNTWVQNIDWSGQGVRVETNQGTVRAKKVIVTVSTGVLAAEKIRFTPALPVDKQEAFRDLKMNSYNHIALQFDGGLPELAPDQYLFGDFHNDEVISWMTNMRGTGLNFGYVGGRYSEALEQAGIQEAVRVGLADLERMLGHDIRKRFKKGFFTTWSFYQNTLGSYAVALPGKFGARRILRETVGERIYFAGEACGREYSATVNGAHLSGVESAKKILRQLG